MCSNRTDDGLTADAGSMAPERSADGTILPDPHKFPHGMRYIADKLHAQGLKMGVCPQQRFLCLRPFTVVL